MYIRTSDIEMHSAVPVPTTTLLFKRHSCLTARE